MFVLTNHYSAMKIIPYILSILLLSACVHTIEEPAPTTPTGGGNNGGGGGGQTDCDPNLVYFTNTIQPLLQSRCAQPECHDQASQQDGVGMFDYNAIMQQVAAGNPGGSDLWEAITEDDPDKIMPPAGEAPLTAAEINLITTWIQQGAQNNSCTSDCDPAAFTFGSTIQPMIQTHCQGCHSGNNPSAGLSLTNYNQIQTIALNGSLIHSINATGGFTLMPYQSNALNDCKKQQLQAWVDAGAPNN